jgi:hypothetical protein
VIRSDMQLAEKASYFHRVIHRDFDLTGICRFVLGPIGASRVQTSGRSSAVSSRMGSFISTAGSSRNPAAEISW